MEKSSEMGLHQLVGMGRKEGCCLAKLNLGRFKSPGGLGKEVFVG